MSDKCETKTILVSLSLILLVAGSFCINFVHSEKKVGHHSEYTSQSLCENEYKEYCLNCERHYSVNEDIVKCGLSWWYG